MPVPMSSRSRRCRLQTHRIFPGGPVNGTQHCSDLSHVERLLAADGASEDLDVLPPEVGSLDVSWLVEWLCTCGFENA
jgi:hypothetical protein